MAGRVSSSVLLVFLLAYAACASDDGPVQTEVDGPDGGTPPVDAPGADAGTDGDGEEAPVREVHRAGRFDDEGRFAWPGTSVRARFEGSSIAIELADSGTNRFEVVVDGEPEDVLSPSAGEGTYVLADGLGAGEHEVVVTRRTESLFGVSTFRGFSGATLVPSPGRTRFIELVGDSITAGFGALGASEACGLDPVTEAETAAWGALAAEALDADHVAIAYSGKGVYRNGGGDTAETMPVLYERILADDPSSAWPEDYDPDVVVVALGTNDFSLGDPGDAFVDAYVAFAASLRARHPDAWILVAESPMLSDVVPAGEMRRTKARAYLEAVVAEREDAGDTRIALVEIAEQLESDGYGCSMHPSAATHAKMADALEERIRELTGW